MENTNQHSPTQTGSKQKNSKSKLLKLRAFRIAQKELERISICRSLMLKSYPLNVKILLGSLVIGMTIIFHVLFIIYDAETFAEYTQCTYTGSLSVALLLVLMMFALKVEKLFEFIGDCEIIINSSKCKNSKFQTQNSKWSDCNRFTIIILFQKNSSIWTGK